MRRSGFQGRLQDLAVAAHRLGKRIPPGNEAIIQQMSFSSMMVGPKYAGIVPGCDRIHAMERLTLCVGNAQEAAYWMEVIVDKFPDLADEAGRLQAEFADVAAILRERLDSLARPQ